MKKIASLLPVTDQETDSDSALLAMARSGGGCPSENLTGVRAMLLAVLEDAIRTFLGQSPKEIRAQTEAAHWVRSNERKYASFITICELFGLEPSAVRKALFELRRQGTPPTQGIRARKPRENPSVRNPRVRGRGRKPSRWTSNS